MSSPDNRSAWPRSGRPLSAPLFLHDAAGHRHGRRPGASPEDDEGERELQQIVNIGTARLWFSGHVLTPELTYMNASGTWQIETVDGQTDTGLYTSVKVDSKGHVHIGYVDAAEATVRHATNAPAADGVDQDCDGQDG